MLHLRPMTQPEYDIYIEQSYEDYAQERARNFDTPIEDERIVAREQINELLDEGLHTQNHYIWILDHATDGNVGHIWVSVNTERHRAFIYDVAIASEQRGKGYGKRILELLEDELRTMGIRSIGLNVFGTNTIARNLYEKQGYQITNYNMQKEL